MVDVKISPVEIPFDFNEANRRAQTAVDGSNFTNFLHTKDGIRLITWESYDEIIVGTLENGDEHFWWMDNGMALNDQDELNLILYEL